MTRNQEATEHRNIWGQIAPGPPPRMLVVCTVDIMAWVLLQPWLEAARDAGFEVELACADGPYVPRLRKVGYVVHTVPLRRSFNPFLHLIPLWKLYEIMRRGKYSVVNTHSPVASVLGRLAAVAAGVPCRISTVHGFYFHEHMLTPLRWMFIWIERIAGAFTHGFAFVSNEDRESAIRLRIVRNGALTQTIFNGVDVKGVGGPGLAIAEAERLVIRQRYQIPHNHAVVGIVARVVREKGYREFLSMASVVAKDFSRVTFLVVGGTLASDRDHFDSTFRQQVKNLGLEERFVFTGFVEDVPSLLKAMDIFVLPSYREGFPRSILEAMACSLPVIATDIRGCREAVVNEVTGIIVRRKDADDLTAAVVRLLREPDTARHMGKEGHERALILFDCHAMKKGFQMFLSEVYYQNVRPRST